MEKYRKGKNVEEPLAKEGIPIPNLPENFLWMQIHGGTKMQGVLNYAFENFDKHRSVVWTASGPAVKKAVSCAEIMKRELGLTLHQITKICYRTCEEYWDPIIEGLDRLVVNRKAPMIHILLSLDPLDKKELGYQPPGEYQSFKEEPREGSSNQRKSPNRPGSSSGQKKRNQRPYYQKQR